MRRATRALQHRLYLHEVDSDRVSDAIVREFTTAAEPVDGRSAHSEEFRDLAHGQKPAHRLRDRVVRREAVPQGSCRSQGFSWLNPVQQGSSKILARACMDLHIFAFLVGHTSRICTGLHVLARI